jgi:radical SAM protein with 4Fe4S-binding SPASM domain
VSLYSVDEARFEAITRRPGSFSRVLAGIERLRARDLRVVLKVPLMTLNLGDLQAVRDYAARVGADCVAAPTITAKKDGDLAPLSLRADLERALGEIGGPVSGCHPADLDGPLCAAASRYCVITSAGDVMACNILPGSGGNVRERSFREIWEESPWLREVRGIRAKDLPVCGTCSRLSYCGRCHAQALAEDGDLYGPSTHARARAELIERASPAAV